jgi:raffinose/stachyose/melibiose transport system substrate-binding protein
MTAALAGLAALLAFGVASNTPTAAAQQTTTVTVTWSSTTESAFQVLIAAFERAHPRIQINATYAQTSAITTLLQTELQAGNAPDLFYSVPGSGGPTATLPLGKAGYLANLAGSPWVSSIPKTFRNTVEVGHIVYSLPMDISPDLVYYNTARFRQLKLKIPTTFAALLQLCKRVTSKAHVPLFALAAGNFSPNYNFETLPVANLVDGPDPTFISKRLHGKTTFAGSPGWRAAMKQFVSMIGAGCFSKDATGVTSIPAQDQVFVTGGALAMGGSSGLMSGVISTAPNLKWSAFLFPGVKAAKTWLSILPSISIALNAHAQDGSAARTFIDFLAQPTEARLFANAAGGVSTADWVKGVYPSYMRSKPILSVIKARRTTLAGASWYPNPSVLAAEGTDMAGLFTGQTNALGVLGAMDSAFAQ